MFHSICYYYKNAGFWKYLKIKRLVNLKLVLEINMYNKKVRVRIYLRISHETTMVANIIWEGGRAHLELTDALFTSSYK